MIKTLSVLLSVLFATVHIQAASNTTPQKPSAPLSESATISLLTSGPSDMAIFTVWGHSAIRIKDPSTDTDIVFNYGIFSFGEPISFITRFVSGQTDYRLGRTRMIHSIEETLEKNADYYEQVLNLTQKEKETLYGALLENYKPENRVYRYKYFSDNCATRPRELLNKCIEGKLALDTTGSYKSIYKSIFINEDGSYKTYRNVIYELLPTSPWYRFGIDLCLGLPTDNVIGNWDNLFLPIVLKEEIALQKIVSTDGVRPLVKTTNQLLYKETEEDKTEWTNVFSPLLIFWTVFLLTLLHSTFYITTGKDDRWAYVLLYGALGILGIIIFYVSCLSVHEFVYPNFNLLWLNPLHLIISLFIYRNKFQVIEKGLMYTTTIGCIFAILYYSFSKFATISTQQFNSANLPLILTQLIFAGSWIYRNKVTTKNV